MAMEDIAAKVRERLSGANLDGSVKFDCGADGAILVDGETVSPANGPADCTISLSRDDLESMLAGELDPTSAFMQGKLRVDGNMSLAMQLSQAL